MPIKIHELKLEPGYFYRTEKGDKNFEVRKNDRAFFVGDWVLLQEINDQGLRTGRELLRKITYILPGGQFGIEPGYCVLSLLPMKEV